MTTGLREEIDQLLYEEMFEPYGISQTNFIRNGVLRIFEKRIDEMFRVILEGVSKDMTKEQMNYIEPRFLTVFERQKKELLK